MTLKTKPAFVLAISGWKRSGKDFLAEHLVSEYGFQRRAFADTLKEMVSEQYGIPLADMYDQDKKEAPLPQYPVNPRDPFSEMVSASLKAEFKMLDGEYFWTPRAILILEGSCKRSVNTSYWVERTIAKMEGGGCFVIPDLRYESEIDKLKDVLGDAISLVRINRFDTIDSVDASEHDLDSYIFDRVINNRKDKQFALDQLANLMKSIPQNTHMKTGGVEADAVLPISERGSVTQQVGWTSAGTFNSEHYRVSKISVDVYQPDFVQCTCGGGYDPNCEHSHFAPVASL